MASPENDSVSISVPSDLNNEANMEEKASKLKSSSTGNSNKFSAGLMFPYSSISSKWNKVGPPPHLSATRIKKDLFTLFQEPLPGIFVMPEEENFCRVHALILGPFGTPYEGGFFHFVVHFGPSYPIHPPKVEFLTTDGGKVRFNPNLYANGRICLSILGTFSGPQWSPAQNLGSILLSIQSIMNENPLFNEPGFSSERYIGQSDSYNIMLTHETIRVAVCDQLKMILDCQSDESVQEVSSSPKKSLAYPTEFATLIKQSFGDFYECYVESCQKYMNQEGQEMTDIFPEERTQPKRFHFKDLLKRLQHLKERLDALPPSTDDSKEYNVAVTASGEEDILSSLSGDEDAALCPATEPNGMKKTTAVVGGNANVCDGAASRVTSSPSDLIGAKSDQEEKRSDEILSKK